MENTSVHSGVMDVDAILSPELAIPTSFEEQESVEMSVDSSMEEKKTSKKSLDMGASQ